MTAKQEQHAALWILGGLALLLLWLMLSHKGSGSLAPGGEAQVSSPPPTYLTYNLPPFAKWTPDVVPALNVQAGNINVTQPGGAGGGSLPTCGCSEDGGGLYPSLQAMVNDTIAKVKGIETAVIANIWSAFPAGIDIP